MIHVGDQIPLEILERLNYGELERRQGQTGWRGGRGGGAGGGKRGKRRRKVGLTEGQGEKERERGTEKKDSWSEETREKGMEGERKGRA